MIKMLDISHISKSFNKGYIYQDISFVFKAGCYVITGENGVGKSVFLDILAGVSQQDSGSVIMSGIGDNASLNYKRHLTYVPSKPLFFPSATGEDFLSFIYSVKGNKINKEKFDKMVSEFRLNDYIKIKFNDMSLGSQKKLFLATLAMGDSHLIILDEPTNALDDRSNKLLIEILNEYSKSNIVIIATHDHNLINRINPLIIELKSNPICRFHLKEACCT